MLVSAELRWFWRGDEPPSDIERWFDRGDIPAGDGSDLRRDRYFPHRGEPELGVKLRGEGGGNELVEIKGLVATRPPPGLALDIRRLEIWCKWSTSVRPTCPGLLVEKQRRLRKFTADLDEILAQPPQELPATGCHVELTRVVVPDPGDIWWTLGFEAFGGLDHVCGALIRMLQIQGPPRADPGAELSYPAWLQAHYGD
jgi:hypothetical protein